MTKVTNYKEVIKDDESLAIFIRSMSKFEKSFCEAMVAGIDFTMKMEIHGNKGELIHCRVYNDGFERPKRFETRESQRRTQE
jgi:hypothetical protein